MEVPAGNRSIECGVATTSEERAAVHAQRFRARPRRGRCRPGLQANYVVYDAAISFLTLIVTPIVARSFSRVRA